MRTRYMMLVLGIVAGIIISAMLVVHRETPEQRMVRESKEVSAQAATILNAGAGEIAAALVGYYSAQRPIWDEYERWCFQQMTSEGVDEETARIVARRMREIFDPLPFRGGKNE